MTDLKTKRKEDALAAFSELIDVIDTLRSPDGCPWDRKQTYSSLKPYIVEETYEVLDAIESGDMSHLQEELGDVLLQIMLHSQIAFEDNSFHVGDVIRGLSRKMVERHPHVFASTQVRDADEVVTNWEKIKSEQKGERGLLDGVPSALPGLLKAYKMGQKAGRVGFDWPDLVSVREKVSEEITELDEAVSRDRKDEMTHELGDVLFAVAQWGRHLELDPEEAMRQCCDRFKTRFSFVQACAKNGNKEIGEYSIDELEQFWQQAKNNERNI